MLYVGSYRFHPMPLLEVVVVTFLGSGSVCLLVLALMFWLWKRGRKS